MVARVGPRLKKAMKALPFQRHSPDILPRWDMDLWNHTSVTLENLNGIMKLPAFLSSVVVGWWWFLMKVKVQVHV